MKIYHKILIVNLKINTGIIIQRLFINKQFVLDTRHFVHRMYCKNIQVKIIVVNKYIYIYIYIYYNIQTALLYMYKHRELV